MPALAFSAVVAREKIHRLLFLANTFLRGACLYIRPVFISNSVSYTKQQRKMSRFNTVSTPAKTTNLAGGEAFAQSPELELVSILLTSFVKDSFYEKADDQLQRLKKVIGACDKLFVAKAAIYARAVFGMRSITHVTASELAPFIGGTDWGKRFYAAVVHRPDDMMEILAYHTARGGKVSGAMKKGLAMAFDKFDKYKLAKYRGEGKKFKLVDVVNIVHPKPTPKNIEAIAALVKGELKSFDTWETELTRAGQSANDEAEKTELKRDAWSKLIREKKIGYFALLRNLRNIIEQAPEVITEALTMLTDEQLIKKSLVLPFRFITAYDEITKLQGAEHVQSVMKALNTAIDISTSNVPKFPGTTLVVLDVSSSMNGLPSKIGSLFAAILVKSNDCHFMTFADDAQYLNVNTNDSTITIAQSMRFTGGSTNFHSIFNRAIRQYQRVIILSDMQGWVGYHSPAAAFATFCKRTDSNPFVYSFDLNGHGTMQFPQNKVMAIAGFSEKVFDIMSIIEQDKNALINTINNVEF